MREFFRGWKRKLGCGTLVLACVLAAGWVRSFHECETYAISPTKGLQFVLFSIGQRWQLRIYFKQRTVIMMECALKNRGGVSTARFETVIEDENFFNYRVSNGDYSGIVDYLQITEHRGENDRTVVGMHSYWSIVIPLTMLSTWLLLSKPGKSNREKIVEPISENLA